MRYILHYTEPGDIVFDAFCGTGMTGIAAQLCADEQIVRDLGYTIKPDGAVKDAAGNLTSLLGARHAILKDLSPAATHIARTYNLPLQSTLVRDAAKRVVMALKDDCGWMYETRDPNSSDKCQITYVVWSDVFLCPNCGKDLIFWNISVDSDEKKVRSELSCPHCNAEELSKSDLSRFQESTFDHIRGTSHQRAKRIPVLIEYKIGNRRKTKTPDQEDIQLLSRIDKEVPSDFFPDCRIDRDLDLWYERDYRSLGVNNVYDFFTRRALLCLSKCRALISAVQDARTRAALTWAFTSIIEGSSLMNRERPGGMPSKLSGTLYIGALIREIDPIAFFERKIKKLLSLDLPSQANATIETGSSTHCAEMPDNCIDYIFVDPPFGSNIIYSDLSILWEAWLNVYTHTSTEAVVHRRKKENASKLQDYIRLMSACFSEMYRVLKPGRWVTVEFHNTKNSVWNAIQEALLRSGFVIADVRTLDKKQGSFKQITAAGAVKQDLVISAYKPNDGLEERFNLTKGTEDGVWDFLRTHLKQLPVFVSKEGQVETLAERQNFLLFDRMVAFHVQRNVTVPISAAEFYAGLAQRFPERDDMYFLPEQVAEYDKKRMTVKEVLQLQLFVFDEATAIQWLKQQLTRKPQTFQEIHPQFLKEIGGWQKHEKPLELSELLEQNFIRYDGNGEVPSQIHSYLSSNFKELRKLAKDDPELRRKAKDRWYVPDPNKAGDLEKLRERSLLREFEEYRESKQKRLKVFRLEAVRAGFKKAWQERDYATIIEVARKIPENVLQEDPKLLMWYDQAVTRSGEE